MNTKPNIYSIITLGIVLFIAYTYFYKNENNTFDLREQVLQSQIDSLTNTVVEYKNNRDSLDNNIHNLNDSLHLLQSTLVNKSNQIYNFLNS